MDPGIETEYIEFKEPHFQRRLPKIRVPEAGYILSGTGRRISAQAHK